MSIPGAEFWHYGPWAVVAFLLLRFALRVVPNYERLVVLRLGRFTSLRGPGLVWLIPIVEKGIRIRVRDRALWGEDGRVVFKGISLPGRPLDNVIPGQPVTIRRFADQEVLVVAASPAGTT